MNDQISGEPYQDHLSFALFYSLDRNDAVSVERMCRTEMQSKIIFYQALNRFVQEKIYFVLEHCNAL